MSNIHMVGCTDNNSIGALFEGTVLSTTGCYFALIPFLLQLISLHILGALFAYSSQTIEHLHFNVSAGLAVL